MHGGSAPQVKFKAALNVEAERLSFLEGLPVANAVMMTLLAANDEAVRLRAAQIVQDRAWGKAQDRVKVSGDANEPLEIIISRPALDVLPEEERIDLDEARTALKASRGKRIGLDELKAELGL